MFTNYYFCSYFCVDLNHSWHLVSESHVTSSFLFVCFHLSFTLIYVVLHVAWNIMLQDSCIYWFTKDMKFESGICHMSHFDLLSGMLDLATALNS